MTLLDMSLSGGAIILLTALLRRFAGGRLPRRMYMALWDIAMLRLLLPVRISSSFSARVWIASLVTRLGPLAEGMGSTPAAPLEAALGQGALSGPEAFVQEALVQDALVREAAARPQVLAAAQALSVWERLTAAVTPKRVLLAVWLVGALLLVLHFARAYVRSMRLFGESLPDEHPETDRFLRAHPTRRRIRVRLSGCVASPLSYGVMRPVILLPKGICHEDARALSFVLMHELMHIRALDAVRKLLAIACLCLHWMNPLVMVMFLLVNRDMELLCDERVLAACPGDARRDYALTLLAMEERKARLWPVASSFSVNAIEERIKAMMNMKKKSAMSMLLALVIVVTSSAALATSAPQEREPEQEPRTEAVTGGAGRVAAATATTLVSDAPFARTQGDMREGEPFLSRESWEEVYRQYAVFGLGYDAEKGRLTYDGKLVRLFEDMYPIGDGMQAGTVCAYPDGEIDVYGVRDLTGPITRNADGSFDPSGELLGLRAATQEEFDAATAERERGAAQKTSGAVAGGVAQTEIEWWTAYEYRAYMEEQREAMTALAEEKAWGYTGSDGWFQWTPEKVEEAMAVYAGILAQIESGMRVSKPIEGKEEDGLIMGWTDEAVEALEEDEVSVTSTEEAVGTLTVTEEVTFTEWPMAEDLWEQEALNQAYAQWEKTLAPYAAAGLNWTVDTDGSVRMYVGEREARGIWDAHRGAWITWSMGNTRFDAEATEFIAVYDGDELVTLREADESERAFWDEQRSAARN